jgi:hypothetical protein
LTHWDVASRIWPNENLAWGQLVTNDKGGPSFAFGQDDTPLSVDVGVQRPEHSESEALLGEENPPSGVWRKLQAQLRREGIIK